MKENMESFITGSRAYGIPKTNSDIDLVCLVSYETLQKLKDLADPDYKSLSNEEINYPTGYPDTDDRMSLRFGNLNLICVIDVNEFNMWQKTTEELISKKPVTREFSVSYFEEKRDELLLKQLS